MEIKFKITNANLSDSDWMLSIRNDPETILNSFSRQGVNAKSHKVWFKEKLSSDRTKILIGKTVSDSSRIGMVRFDFTTDDFCEVSINLAPRWRDKGLSSKFLQKAIKEVSKNTDVAFIAQVKSENLKSQRCFEKSGFAKYEVLADRIIYVNKQILINKIETVRSRNNVNWMNLMRLAFKSAPKESEMIFESINHDDLVISDLLQKLIKKVDTKCLQK